MSNLYELQRKRLKLYGQMVKNDIMERKKQELIQRQQRKKRDNQELQQHIQNTKRYELSKKIETRELNNSLIQDNMLLSSLKASMVPRYSQDNRDNRDFIKEIHELDVKRLQKLKRQFVDQLRDNSTQAASRKIIQEKLREIEKIENERHKMRTNQMQLESIRNYQNIKNKHQQNMALFQAHKRLVEENQKYKSEIQGFTNVDHGILDRYHRNQYMLRRSAMNKNQQVIKQQMQEIERRKNQDILEYKKNVGDLEHSMLKSVLLKPERNDLQSYSMDLKSQIRESSLKKNEEIRQKKQKIEINNIFGGVHGQQRQKMIHYIDRQLGLSQLQRTKTTNSGYLDNLNKTYEQKIARNTDNPQYMNIQPKYQSYINNSHEMISQRQAKGYPIKETENNYNNEKKGNNSYQNQTKKYYKSYDPISGKNRLYAAD